MPFFQQFPKIPYDFDSNGIDTNIVDLFRFVKANEQYFHEIATYIDYQIRDGERPDIVSNSLYGTPEYYWVFFLINEHLKNGISGWPMPEQELLKYIAEEYPGTTIETRPEITLTGDDLSIGRHPNSLSERFVFGERIFGSISGARGIVIGKNIQQSQLRAVTLAQYRLTVAAPVALATGSFVIGSTYKIVTAATPTVAITGGGGNYAAAKAIISGATGSLTGFTITNAGSGYTTAPSVVISGNGAGGGDVNLVTITAGGTGYTGVPTVSFSGGGGSGAAATATVANGAVTGITITNPGTGYTGAPTVTITAGGGSGATATATVANGLVTGITITNAGSGYNNAPTVTITAGGGSGATATATVANGAVTGLTITAGGTNYTSAPTVTITGGGGSGATATATIFPGATATAIISATGSLTGFTITSPGRGYTSFPGAATNTVGSVFTATGIGTGIGTAHPTYIPGESISMTLPNGTIRSALIFEVESPTSLIVGYVSGSFTAGLTLTGPISKCARAYVSIAQTERFFQDTEIITGQNSGDTVTSYKVYDSPDAPHHYLNSDGLVSYNSLHIDEKNFAPSAPWLPSTMSLTAVSNRAYEIEVNEQRSRIRIIHPDYIYKFVQLYYSLINKNAS